MISHWYRKLAATQLYRAFLRHRVWQAKMIIATHILFCFPLSSAFVVWVFIPLVIVDFGAAMLFSGYGLPDGAIVVSSIACFSLATPIVLRIYGDFFEGYIAGLLAVFGRPEKAQTFLEKTQHRLSNWEREFA